MMVLFAALIASSSAATTTFKKMATTKTTTGKMMTTTTKPGGDTSCSSPNITDPAVNLPIKVPAYLNCLSTGGTCKDADASWIEDLSTVPSGSCAVIVNGPVPLPCSTPLGTAFGLMAQATGKTLDDGIVAALAGSWSITNLCCATCASAAAATTTTSAAATTTTVTVQATTTAQALIVAKYEGSYTISAPDVTVAQMETAAKSAMASQFGLDAANVDLTVTETRRLSEDVRRLAGNFNIAFVLTVPAAQAAAVTAAVEAAKADGAAFKTSFAAQLKPALVAAGVSQETANGLSVTSDFTATAAYVLAPATTTAQSTAVASLPDGAYQGVSSMVVMVAIKMLFWDM